MKTKNLKVQLGLVKAEQQICGFHHASQGYSLSELLCAMALEKTEYEEMTRKGMLNYLTDNEKNEIQAYYGDK